jgi:hypothetical protein
MASLKNLISKFDSRTTNQSIGDDIQYRLIQLLVKAVGLIEEAYEKDFDLLHPDNALDYKEMIDALNDYGVKYGGKKEILELAIQQYAPASGTKIPETRKRPQKLPMKKAGGKNKDQSSHLKRKSG